MIRSRSFLLCAAHHRAIHRGALIVEGSRAQSLTFRHADGSSYRRTASPRSVAAQAQAFAALIRLGFREGEVRRALDRVRTEVGMGGDQDAQHFVRAALRLLTPQSATAP
jgi:Holliday junction resolvasome RuvABC DNA-binding subunit